MCIEFGTESYLQVGIGYRFDSHSHVKGHYSNFIMIDIRAGSYEISVEEFLRPRQCEGHCHFVGTSDASLPQNNTRNTMATVASNGLQLQNDATRQHPRPFLAQRQAAVTYWYIWKGFQMSSAILGKVTVSPLVIPFLRQSKEMTGPWWQYCTAIFSGLCS